MLDTRSSPVNLLVRGRHVVTMDGARTVIRDGAVAVVGTAVAQVGTWRDLRRRHPTAPVLGSATSVVTPGYVNAHQHLTGDRLVRSCIPDGIDSSEAIFGWAVPVHAAHTAADDELSATLSLVEAVGNGVTCTVEAGTVAHPERVAAALRTVGMRAALGRWGWDVGDGPQAAPAGEVLDRQEALLDALVDDPMIDGWVTLVGHDLMTDELVSSASELARRRGSGFTFHLSPTSADVRSYLERTGRRPLLHLDHLGVLGPHVLIAHAVHLDDDELDVLLGTRAAVASCPWAYLRLAQGFTVAGRHGELLRRGGRVAIGCDAENASDAIDPLRAAALFVGIARDQALDPASHTAADALELLTIRGAEAIGMADRIGSLEPGKQADLVVHDTTGPAWVPDAPDPVLQLVWASDGRSVSDVVVAGRPVVVAGRCTTVDVEALVAEAGSRQRALLRAAGRG